MLEVHVHRLNQQKLQMHDIRKKEAKSLKEHLRSLQKTWKKEAKPDFIQLAK